MTRLVSRFYMVPLLMLLAIWCGHFIQQSSFDIDGERYYSLFDDAMISMTYAKNLTQGHGLNWAKFGDPVEGFSSPLWTFLMVPFQLLPVEWGKVSLFFSIFCAAILGLNIVLLDRILRRRLGIESVIPRIAATFSLAFLYPLNFWSLVGMECGPQVLIFLLGLDQFLAFQTQKSPKILFQLGGILAAGLLLRMDMVFFVGITILFLAPWLLQNRIPGLKFLLIAGLPMAAYLVFRGFYFGDVFPNTYYLKLFQIPLDIRLERAWFHFRVWAEPLWLVWVLLPLMMIPLRRNKALWLSLVLIVTYLAYNLYAGGDAWEEGEIGANRFTIITIPWIIVIFSAGGYAWGKMIQGKAGDFVRNLLPASACLLVFVLVNGLLFVPNSNKAWNRLMVKDPPYNTQFQMWNVMKALDVNRSFGSANRVAVVQAGDLGYFTNCELVDVLGYNDRVIARLEPYWDLRATPINFYTPGHVKVDYRHIIMDLQPDFVLDRWTRYNPEVERECDSLLAAYQFVPHPQGGWLKAGFVRKDK